ncbi:LytR/AlgR family response regulator transcription factor [Clostridium lundense]|uniref:LytR/AlgR family response regulator transcription factor n=1 Tax=Clostridium lundense TaxID=319475 RepID=UPI000483230E|nr:LytTR family DNA-binding domain-containing protein [Clostridium lundense]
MKKISCIIVEDEIPAAEELKYILSEYEFLNVCAIAHDGENGFNIIKSQNPAVVFLDINMPIKNGIDLATDIKEFNSDIEIVFVTAYEEHALEAFEVAALDYILKPYDEKRIKNTINRIYNKLAKDPNTEITKTINKIINKLDNTQNAIQKIPCEYHGKIILIPLEDIFYCYTENEKIYVKTYNNKYFTNYTMNRLQKKSKFFRAHRSYLVNLDNIKELYSWFNGTYKLVMNDMETSEVPISRNNVKKLKEILGI